ncbi:hypothetical protein SLEP1_g22812 [Rubroshorea leprosula]|uniref:RNase H type-1 domain-containing protein n=1 Tax=Rubroshorea leprosula TaxID=152421 RepID=A0AAV5JJJ8_9ROSI|nr:hypothetical protein SLEP1_g22812 [Rubroshorea leprosula]
MEESLEQQKQKQLDRTVLQNAFHDTTHATVAFLTFPQLKLLVDDVIQARQGGTSQSSLVCAKPYTRGIDKLSLTNNYQPPKFQKFNGKSNPKQHIAHFVETCNNVGTYKGLMVKQFVQSLEDAIFEWYTDLLAGNHHLSQKMRLVMVSQPSSEEDDYKALPIKLPQIKQKNDGKFIVRPIKDPSSSSKVHLSVEDVKVLKEDLVLPLSALSKLGISNPVIKEVVETTIAHKKQPQGCFDLRAQMLLKKVGFKEGESRQLRDLNFIFTDPKVAVHHLAVKHEAIKGQALADFLIDHPIPAKWELLQGFPDEEMFFVDLLPSWNLYFDGASRRDENNVPIIVGMEMALEMNIYQLNVYGDSSLVVNQLIKEFNVRKPDLVPYFQYASQLLKKFDHVLIAHVPRSQNRQANALANLAAIIASPDNQEVTVSVS